jgi:GNAT superfamily N-acetyltransferase
MSEIRIRRAEPADAALVHQLVLELAAYEKLTHEATATEADIAKALFGEPVRVFCKLAELDGKAVGFALWFYNYSTFQGRPGMYLEDLYVRPDARHAGVGGALLKALGQVCVEEGLGRMSWLVLNWNAPAIDFYAGLGAQLIEDWSGARLEGEALRRLGSEP